MPRFAANLSMMFNELPFLERFQAAADAGFGAVEYLFPYEHPAQVVAETLQSAGLKQALFNMPPGNWASGDRGLAALPERRDEFNASIETSVYYAKIIGTPLLHLMAGIAERDATSIATYRDAVKRAGDAAGEAGVGLVVEPINSRDMPGYFLNDFNWAADFINDLAHPNVRLQFDIYHCQIQHGDLQRTLERLFPLIGHVQIASVPLRHEPGSGELNDFYVLRLLDKLGYTGYVGCEYRPAASTTDGLGWMKAFSQDVATL